ncbi:MAG: leucine-rich repeat domain-containing protein [Oscillospiraceae bacterium]
MKKITSLLLALLLILSLTACGEKSTSDTNEEINSSQSENADVQDENNTVPDDRITQMQAATLQYPSKNDEWSYNVYDCYVEITDYIGAETGKLEIPATIEGLPVWVINSVGHDHIGEDWDTPLIELVLSDNILIIGDYVFYESDIEKVTFPEGLETIGEGAFYGCSLKEIDLPDTLKSVGDFAFGSAIDNNTIIDELVIPDSVVSIGECAFNGFTLRSVVIPASVKSIGENAFLSCNLTIGDRYDENGEWIEDPRIFHDVDIYIYSQDVVINGDIGGGTIHGYAGSTTASYCAEYNKTMEIIPE